MKKILAGQVTARLFLYLALPSTAISTATPKIFYFLSFFAQAKIWLNYAKKGNRKK